MAMPVKFNVGLKSKWKKEDIAISTDFWLTLENISLEIY